MRGSLRIASAAAAAARYLPILAALLITPFFQHLAHACEHHGVDTGCQAAEQPSAAYRAFQSQQRQAVLAEFARRAEVRRRGEDPATVASALSANHDRQRRRLAEAVSDLPVTDTPTAAPSAFPTDNTTALPLPPGVHELPVRKCAYEEDEAVIVAATNELAPTVEYLTGAGAGRAVTYNINTYVHLLSNNNKFYATTTMVKNQIAVLNKAYASANFVFTLSGIIKTTNSSWYPLDIFSQAKADMQQRLRKGGPADLNIYVTMLNNGGIIGVSSNPWGVGVGALPYDGSLVDLGTLPGSWYLGYNVGNNAVHEVGHWMGLSHPFVGGCTEINDGVTDTAEMSAPNYACYPKGSQKPNSCPNKPKNQPTTDPVNKPQQAFEVTSPSACSQEADSEANAEADTKADTEADTEADA